MKILVKIMDKARPLFKKDGKLSRLHYIFQALDNIFFAAPDRTGNAPYGRDPMDVKRYMSLVITALIPCLAASVYFFGWRIIFMVAVSYAAGAIVEVLFSIIRREEVNEGFLVTGFIFPLILPPGIPLWLVAVGIIFGVLVGKAVFGGTGRNLFNPALVGRAFLVLGYPSLMTASWVDPGNGVWGKLLSPIHLGAPDAIASATPLVTAKSGELANLLDLFLGRVSGSAGETSAVAVLLGGVFLVATGVANWRTIVAVLVSFAGLTAVLWGFLPDVVNPVGFNLLAGGVLFGTFFMATDPVSSPATLSGKWAYGILIGAAAVLIRNFSGFVEGMMFAILFGNICAPLIDEAVIRLRMRRYAHER